MLSCADTFDVAPNGPGYWWGFFTAILLMVLCGAAAYCAMVYINRQTHRSPFIDFVPDAADPSELGTDLLRADFRFSDS